MPAQIKSGMAASISRGMVHIVDEAALAVDADGAQLAVRWICGNGAVNARPADPSEVACDACEQLQHLPRGPVVYRCYGTDGDLLYIGSSANVRIRVRAHSTGTRWWDEVAQVEAEPFPTITAARLAEAQAIIAELPSRNRANIPLRVIRGGAA
jgi:hypothetical protein